MILKNNTSQVKMGAALAYILIIANALYGLFLSPYILDILGKTSYGVYKSISSLTSTMMILDFGLGGMVMRYVADFRAGKKEEKISPFVSLALNEAGIMSGVVVVVSTILFFQIESFYGQSFTQSELSLSKILFIILASNMVVHVFENVLNGVITGYNHFILGNGIKLARLAIRVISFLVFLRIFQNPIVLVIVDLTMTVLTLVFEAIYVTKKYNIKLSFAFHITDKIIFKESLRYAFLFFISSICAQINNNLDNVIIGSMKGPALVTIYSFALVIFSMFEQLSTAISGVMLPTVAEALKKEDGGETVQKLVISGGRVQFMLLGAAAVCFIVVGRQFVSLWLGTGFEDVYIISLILIIPALLELCVNICLSVLRAKNKLGFRTAMLFLSTILNLIVSIIGVKYYGYIAAAIGTAVSFILGSVIIMNVYYIVVWQFRMLQIYREIFRGTWLSLLISGAVIFFSSKYLHGTWLELLINIIIFCAVYVACLLLFGLREEEKTKLRFSKRERNK